MSNAHINAVMTVMQLERSARAKEYKASLTENVHRRPHYRSIINEMLEEMRDCDDRLDELSKSHAKYY